MKAYLMHHGILGQKWGVRRFQNEDGTLTKLGKYNAKANRQKNKMTGYKEERKKAQELGSSSVKRYEELSKLYDKGEITDEEFDKRMEKEVYGPLEKAGYDYIYRGGGYSDGKTYYSLQFGRDLSDTEVEQRKGEEWVQEWIAYSDRYGIDDPEHDW